MMSRAKIPGRLPGSAFACLPILLLLGLAACGGAGEKGHDDAKSGKDEHGHAAGESHGEDEKKPDEHGHAPGDPAEGQDEHGHAEERADAHGHDENAAGGDEHGPGAPEAIELAGLRGISFARVEAPRRESVFAAAEAAADENASELVPAPLAGQVADVAVLPGKDVRRGDLLMTLHSPALVRLRSEVLTARAELSRARADREREERMLAAGATARRDVEAAQAAEAVALAREAAALSDLRVRGLGESGTSARVEVRAPRAGKVVELQVRRGQTVEEAAPLVTLLAGKAALVRLELPLPGPADWPAGSVTEVRRADGRRWTAKLEGEPASLSADSRRLLYRFRLEGDDLPLPGTPVEVKVPLDAGYVLPQIALQQIEGNWGVFRRQGEGAVFVKVRRGAEVGGDVLVIDGVTEGDTVATSGAYLLKALLLKRAGGGGDAHDH